MRKGKTVTQNHEFMKQEERPVTNLLDSKSDLKGGNNVFCHMRTLTPQDFPQDFKSRSSSQRIFYPQT